MSTKNIFQAAETGNLETVREILTKTPAAVNTANTDRTPLHAAAADGHKEVTALLLKNGANVNTANTDGRTPLHYAAADGHKEVAALLRQTAKAQQEQRTALLEKARKTLDVLQGAQLTKEQKAALANLKKVVKAL